MSNLTGRALGPGGEKPSNGPSHPAFTSISTCTHGANLPPHASAPTCCTSVHFTCTRPACATSAGAACPSRRLQRQTAISETTTSHPSVSANNSPSDHFSSSPLYSHLPLQPVDTRLSTGVARLVVLLGLLVRPAFATLMHRSPVSLVRTLSNLTSLPPTVADSGPSARET